MDIWKRCLYSPWIVAPRVDPHLLQENLWIDQIHLLQLPVVCYFPVLLIERNQFSFACASLINSKKILGPFFDFTALVSLHPKVIW